MTIDSLVQETMVDIYDNYQIYDTLEEYIHRVAHEAYELGFKDGEKSVGSKPSPHTHRHHESDCSCGHSCCGENSLQERGIKAAINFLQRRDMEIICDGDDALNVIDIVARDEDSNIHFIIVDTRDKGNTLEEVQLDRVAAESDALVYLTEHNALLEDDNVKTYFDIITIVRTADDRALLKFHENALSGD